MSLKTAHTKPGFQPMLSQSSCPHPFPRHPQKTKGRPLSIGELHPSSPRFILGALLPCYRFLRENFSVLFLSSPLKEDCCSWKDLTPFIQVHFIKFPGLKKNKEELPNATHFLFHGSICHISSVMPILGLNCLFTSRHHYRFNGNGIFSYTEPVNCDSSTDQCERQEELLFWPGMRLWICSGEQ